MAQLKKIGEQYYVEYIAQGLMFRKYAGKDKSKAEELLLSIESSIGKTHEEIYTVRDISLDDFVKKFLYFIKENFSFKTYQRFFAVIEHFTTFTNREYKDIIKLSELTPKVLVDYQDSIKNIDHFGRKIGPQMINFSMMLLSFAFDYAIKEGDLNDNPTLHILPALGLMKEPALYSDNEVTSFQDHLNQEEYKVVMTAFFTGISKRELLLLNSESFDFEKKILNVKSVNGNFREVPLSDKLITIIKPKKRFDEVLNRNSILEVDVDFIKLRNTFAKTVLESGLSLFRLFYLLGFDDIARVFYYYPLKPLPQLD